MGSAPAPVPVTSLLIRSTMMTGVQLRYPGMNAAGLRNMRRQSGALNAVVMYRGLPGGLGCVPGRDNACPVLPLYLTAYLYGSNAIRAIRYAILHLARGVPGMPS